MTTSTRIVDYWKLSQWRIDAQTYPIVTSVRRVEAFVPTK